jgi:hypothetical protein
MSYHPIDPVLHRLRAQVGLLRDANPDSSAANDLDTVISWIEYTKPLLGAVSPGVTLADLRKGFQLQSQGGDPPEPKPDDEPDPAQGTETPPAPVEDPPQATA